jgi:hypothetical protein
MEILLVTVTMASLLAAAGMAALVWRMKRDERERSAARVAALSAAIADDPIPEAWSQPWPAPGPEGNAATPVRDGLFSSPADDRPPLARMVPMLLAGLVIVGSVAVGVAMTGATADPPASGPRPLELLSLRHAVREGTLEVTGLLRNPATNPAFDAVTAVVFLFDGQGAFLASGRASLDFRSLAPGEESPFVVSLPAAPGVARYRVSFRRDERGVIPHVDRREARQP